MENNIMEMIDKLREFDVNISNLQIQRREISQQLRNVDIMIEAIQLQASEWRQKIAIALEAKIRWG